MTNVHRRFSHTPRFRAIWSTAFVDWTLIIALLFFLSAFVYNYENGARNWSPFVLIGAGLSFLVQRRWNERVGGERLHHGPSDHRSIEDRLDELERLKRRDMVTPEEYAAKRQEILRDL